jgi:hypothetical protein
MYYFSFINTKGKLSGPISYHCRERLLYFYNSKFKQRKSDRYVLEISDSKHIEFNVENVSIFLSKYLLSDLLTISVTKEKLVINGLVSSACFSLLYYLWSDREFLFKDSSSPRDVIKKILYTKWFYSTICTTTAIRTAIYAFGVINKKFPILNRDEIHKEPYNGPSSYLCSLVYPYNLPAGDNFGDVIKEEIKYFYEEFKDELKEIKTKYKVNTCIYIGEY